nr:hypothetical protein [Angustibacter aerolatus]
MTILVAALCLLAGALVGVLVTRSWAAARAAGLVAERELLRERVVDLEADVGRDREPGGRAGAAARRAAARRAAGGGARARPHRAVRPAR